MADVLIVNGQPYARDFEACPLQYPTLGSVGEDELTLQDAEEEMDELALVLETCEQLTQPTFRLRCPFDAGHRSTDR